MKVGVVAFPWQDVRPALQAVVVAAEAHRWVLSVSTDLPEVPGWARHRYRPYDPAAPLDAYDVVVWLAPVPCPPVRAAWVITTHPDIPASRWTGQPARGGWMLTEGTSMQQVLWVPDAAKAFQAWAAGGAAWPEGSAWTGPVLPGRLCPVAWWSDGVWQPRGVVGVERLTP